MSKDTKNIIIFLNQIAEPQYVQDIHSREPVRRLLLQGKWQKI